MSRFRRRGKDLTPEHRSITSVPWFDTHSATAAGESVNERTAMRISAVWACVTLLADLISSMPVDVYRIGKDFQTVPVDPIGIIAKPSLIGFTRREWMQQAMVSLLLRGNAYGLVTVRDALGRPQHIEWLYLEDVTVVHVNAWDIPQYFVRGVPTPREDLLHLRAHLRPGRVVGLSPIEYQAETLGVAIAAQQFGAQWFGQGAHPSAILTSDQRIDPEQAQAMKQRFLASIRGKREPAVLGAGITYTPIQVSANESQFLETMQASIADIARIYKVPVELIGASPTGTGSLTYANREQRNLDLLTYAVQPWLVKFEDALTSLLPRGQYAKFNVDSLLRSDTKTRYEAHAIALDAGFKTVDEVRAIEDDPPLGDGSTNRSHAALRKVQEMAKNVSYAVDVAITPDEARQLINDAGGDLPLPGPVLGLAAQTAAKAELAPTPPAPQPAPEAPDAAA